MSCSTDVSFDLETLSLDANASILSIGAAAFNSRGITARHQWIIEPGSDVGGVIDPKTVGWWLQQSAEARAEFTRPKTPLGFVLLEIPMTLNIGETTRVWGHGATADITWLAQAYSRAGRTVPFAYKRIRDTRTLFELAGVDVTRGVGVHHSALDDATEQARTIIRAVDRLGLTDVLWPPPCIGVVDSQTEPHALAGEGS